MMKWFNALSGFEQSMFIIGIIAIVLLFLQLLAMLIGFGFGDASFDDALSFEDIDTVNDSGVFDVLGLRLLTLRGIIAFFGVGSWTALVVSTSTEILWLAILSGCITGAIAMLLLAYAMKKMLLLESDGNVDLENAVGKIASVYIPIPKRSEGSGKISLVVQNRFYEFDAISATEEELPSYSEVEVISVLNNALVVKRVNQMKEEENK